MSKYLPLLLIVAVITIACATEKFAVKESGFPDFITANNKYYVTRIGEIPQIDGSSYSLEVKGLVRRPRSFSLEELYAMELIELPFAERQAALYGEAA